MKKILLLTWFWINFIIVAFLFWIYNSWIITVDYAYILIFCINFILVIIFWFILLIKSSNKNLEKEIQIYREEKNKFTGEKRKIIKEESDIKSQENIRNLIYIFIFILVISILWEYWEPISNILLWIIFLVFWWIWSAINWLTSIKWLLFIIVVLLFIIIKKLNNNN